MHMRKETVQEAATTEEAVAQAAKELGVDESQLEVEVLQQPQKKTLGLFGGQAAKIKATLKNGEVTATTAGEQGKAYLQGVLDAMGAANTSITVTETERGVSLSLEGDHLGFVIGHRGETLDALQYLTGLAANRGGRGSYCRLTVDIGNYREKRAETLSALARKNALQAAKTGRKISLEPMNPYERHIIHSTVQDISGADSWSVGKDNFRHVVIGPSDDNPLKNRKSGGQGNYKSGGYRGHGGGNRPQKPKKEKLNDADIYTRYADTIERPMREFVSRQNPLPMADGATPPQDKTESQVENSDAKLYGKIDV